MLTVLGISGPIFFIIALGFVGTRMRLLKPQEAKPLGTFVIHFALPALLFKALAQRTPNQLLGDGIMLDYAIGSVAIFIGATLVLSFSYGLRKAATLGIGTSLSNSAFMGLPIAEEVFGDNAVEMLAIYVFVENLILVPLMLILAEIHSDRKGHWITICKDISTRLMKNPLVLAMIAGMLCSIFEIRLNGPTERTINLLAGASAPTALFYIGSILAGMRFKALNWRIALITPTKLLLHPLAVFVVFHCFSTADEATVKAATLNAAMPMATIYPLLAHRYGQEEPCSAALLLTTALSFLSISGLLWLL